VGIQGPLASRLNFSCVVRFLVLLMNPDHGVKSVFPVVFARTWFSSLRIRMFRRFLGNVK
jgi:hypothetical protein